jgi:hypothetical protein
MHNLTASPIRISNAIIKKYQRDSIQDWWLVARDGEFATD